MRLTKTSSRILVWIVSLLLLDVSIVYPPLFPVSFITTVLASSSPTLQSSSENSQDLIATILDRKNQNEKDDSVSSPFESIWKTFKDIVDSTTKNVLSTSLSSYASDSSTEEYNPTTRSELGIKDDMLNRRGLLMEQSLNEHYTHQLLNFFPALKEYFFMAEEEGASEKIRNGASLTNFVRWRQPDPLTGKTTCCCFSESPNSYWSFQWCPQKEIIYQGRRSGKGVLESQYVLGMGLAWAPKSTNDAQYLMTTAKAKYPSAVAIHPYVDGDTCVEGGMQRRASVVVLHTSTSEKCGKRVVRDSFIESVVEVRVCQYMLHVCLDYTTESLLGLDTINTSENDGDKAPSSFAELGAELITESTLREFNQTLHYIKNHVTESFVRKSREDARGKTRENMLTSLHSALPPLPQSRIKANLKLVKDMFMHAYDSYMYNGYPASEVKPITCAPASFNLVKIPGLTLIDSLDTLVILGNYTEFARAVERLRFLNDNVYEATGIYTTGRGLFDINYNVSVFETNIRVLGGLLSAHQLATAFLEDKVLEKEVWAKDKSILIGFHHETGMEDSNEEREIDSNIQSSDCDTTSTILQYEQESSSRKKCHNQTNRHWVYDGFLLELARDIGDRLLPAFNTQTGIPYGTVNLISGIPKGETPIASLAGGGTLSLEMELLSRLTGNAEYGRAAKLSARALWMRRSSLDILGKHICTRKGHWTETLSGIGSNSDSFYEYLIKHHILFPEDSDFWHQLVAAHGGVHNESRVGEWYGDVDMKWGQAQNGAPKRVLEALMAFYPGMQVLLGEVTPAARTLNSFFLVREYLGFLPERFQYGSWKVDYGGGSHLLRPELLESAYFLHRSSKGFQTQFRSQLNNHSSDSSGWVWSGDFALHTIEKLTRSKCGYASVRDVSPEISGKLKAERNQIGLLDEMPSYFLSETLKYLYLLFDDDNILHTDEERDWVFTTEAHPIHNEQKETSANAKLIQQTEELKIRLQRRFNKRKKTTNDMRKTLINEKWTASSRMEDFIQQLEPLVKNDSKTYENQRLLDRDVSQSENLFSSAVERLFPNDNAWSPFDIFNERLQTPNPTFLTFRKLGNERDLTNSCPNLYTSKFLWIRALNGGIADYSDSYRSTTMDDFLVSERDIIQLGSVDALALHGSGVHIESYYNAFFQDSIQDKKQRKEKKVSKELESTESQGDVSNGSTRFEMGDGMGSFDISAFPGGTGFYVQHVESGETVVATVIEEATSSDSQGPLIMVYSKIGANLHDIDTSKPRSVVLADVRGNSYSCEIQIIEQEDSTCDLDKGLEKDLENTADSDLEFTEAENEDNVLHRFPCSPGLFGPTHISHLEKVKSTKVEARVQPSGVHDRNGCGRFSMLKRSRKSDLSSLHSDQVPNDEKMPVISLVHRGECTFQEKSFNKKLTEHAEGVIVINNNKGDDLFVMSGGGSEELASLDEEEYPLTVLVSWADGQKILKTMNAVDKSGETEIYARISIVQDESPVDMELKGGRKSKPKFWPRVTASSEALQIYSRSGWGIQAVQMSVDNENSNVNKAELQWQLYLLKHDMVE